MPKQTQKNGTLRWDFPSTNHGKEDGFADPAIEFFEGDHNRFIARETIQNAIDARCDYTKPVTVIFEHLTVPTPSFPGRDVFAQKMKKCLEFVADQDKAEEFFKNAAIILKNAKLSVLKVSDFNTVGLSGSDEDRKGNWYRLVRVTGTSSPKGVAGGSFGIGKGAPFAGSNLRAVFYSSSSSNGEVFQGVARLVSHYDDNRDVRQGIGFFGVDGYKAVRNKDMIPEFFRREQKGTDIFIMGYKDEDDWKDKLIHSVLDNFWLAILHGDLEVVVRDGSEILITKDNLREKFDEYGADSAKAYFEATTSWDEKFEKDLQHLGRAILFVRKNEDYPSRAMMVRKPKMFVTDKQYHTLREPYAAVFVCDDEKGNRLLRDLEPPAHDKWDKGRAEKVKNGLCALRELDEFIKESLRSMAGNNASEPEDIPGLNKYLPDSEERDYIPRDGEAFDPTELEAKEESGREIGAEKDESPATVERIVRKSIVTNKLPGKVRPTPPQGPGNGPHGRATGSDEGKEEGVRIKTSTVSFRSFLQRSKNGIEYHLAITGRESAEGAIRLVAIGDDNSYPVEIESAKDLNTGKSYEIMGTLIKGLSIPKGKTAKIRVILKSNAKYTLGIENHEG